MLSIYTPIRLDDSVTLCANCWPDFHQTYEWSLADPHQWLYTLQNYILLYTPYNGVLGGINCFHVHLSIHPSIIPSVHNILVFSPDILKSKRCKFDKLCMHIDIDKMYICNET